ncbi:MAG: DUF58 domain-containing protein [Pseudomonadales bacterium]|nr:DUF58 domain-containing protein [Pseudomonadales bacterium]
MPKSSDKYDFDIFDLKGGAYTDVSELIRLRHAAKQLSAISFKNSNSPMSGYLTSKFRGRGIDFAEVRAYEPGDDVRTIDWRVTARTQIPHTKLFQEEKERPILILVDQSQSMFFGSKRAFKSVTAAQTAALIAWLSLANGDRVGGLVFSQTRHREIRPARSKHAVLRLINEINEFNHALNKEFNSQPHQSPSSSNSSNDSYLAEALINLRQVAKHGCAIFLISDFCNLDATALMHLQKLASHNDIIGIHISDPMERDLPKPELYTISNGQQRIQINTSNTKHRVDYQHQFAANLAQIKTEFSKMKSPCFEIQTKENCITALSDAIEYRQRASF